MRRGAARAVGIGHVVVACLACSGGTAAVVAQQRGGGPVLAVDASFSGVFDTNLLRETIAREAYSGGGEMLLRLSNRVSRPTLQLEYAAAFRGSSIHDPNAGVGQRVSALAAAQLTPFARLNLIGRGGRGGVDEDLSAVDEVMLLGRLDLEPRRAIRLRGYGAHRWRDQGAVPEPAIGQYAGAELRLAGAGTSLLLDARYERFALSDSTRDWQRRGLTMSTAQRIGARTALELEARHRIRDYPRRLVRIDEAGERVPRADTDWRFGASWIYDTRVGTEIRFAYEYEDRASNDVRRAYDAHRITLNFRQRILGFGARRDAPPIDERAVTPVIHGAASAAPPAAGFAEIVVGGAAFCARTGAALTWCWPEQVDGVSSVPGGWTVLAAGPRTACALDPAGAAHCWSLTGPSFQPVRVRTEVRFTALAVGAEHACGLAADGGAWCWGSNRYGQLGTGTTRATSIPEAAAAGVRFRAIGAGAGHSCGLDLEGAVWCWGSNESGQAAAPTTLATVLRPKRIEGFRFASLSAGMSHNCALTEAGAAYCWGNGSRGQLGTGATGFSSEPARVAHDGAFTTIAAGWAHTCALDTAGRAYCWGQNRYGQLGLGNPDGEPHPAPRAVSGEQAFTALDVSLRTCALDDGRRIHCWGSGLDGRGPAAPRLVSVPPTKKAIGTRPR